MKKKLFVLLLTVAIACIFAISVSAITTYDDAPVRTKYTSIEDDIVEFYDGFKCPVSYVFKDTDFVDRSYNKSGGSFQNYFDFEYINGKTGKNYTFEDVKGFDIPEGINSIGIYAGRELNTLKWISIPKTATKLSGAIFQSPWGTFREVSRTSRAFSPKMARSRRSSGVSSVSPLGVTLPTR